ncbi:MULTISPECIES: tRNA (adenosine(37)-N6)-threonylcarbamoyltransferase complex dimerization subunit type 1 TsaB [Marinobacter]|uniref:tRNA (adenosine(37)-N6)-threonylcarbamoyltransferase complex dimerization subunit type 1 TsaB n=1 Tax=Marinobacter TaxID=2742 RepID=UPI000C358599|nr:MULTISPECIES: tRNA (adenosine(37)-N6)-threonylcarbamoyltransferase complex dimerization subunit type 1 TsaB [Marinobacter]MDX5441577.1 tRNA (adenosine(37)-N6)-threonylcarbamoyltransferase complex dimerization subunit type 1 TsaB [Alteromonadaceae bacterium]WBU42262.1 tRNA (adenosine(37)-N6)-threonylcarbamoyltransferase complex dimerization subunit type 1 TsaB [Marinobacter alkaliphilus]MAO14668.1 tRNA (adenosine(37)-N6)-threonylcarbamoyltransferase complex dimerization subunit type 1 TsaB [Ma
MKLLALDTSSEGCSAALWLDGQISERFELAPRGHTRLLMPMVRELLAEQGLSPNDLDALAFARGPGSFTGLRIATGVIQGLAWGLNLPVVPVSSLSAVALDAIEQHQLADGEHIAVAFDARMGEVYWGTFLCQQGLPVLIGEERVCPPGAVSLPDSDVSANWTGAGQGWTLKGDMPEVVVCRIRAVDDTLVPRAAMVARLAEQDFRHGIAVPAELAQPVYIRDEVAWKKLPGRA